MSVAESSKRKKQLGLIAILLFILLIALTTSPETEKPTSVGGSPAPATLISLKPAETPESAMPADAPATFVLAVDNMPSLTDEQIQSGDLFRRPPPEPTDQRTVRGENPYPRSEHKVGAIYGAYRGSKQSALIDGQIVQTGQQLESGERVLAVSDDGVEVKP